MPPTLKRLLRILVILVVFLPYGSFSQDQADVDVFEAVLQYELKNAPFFYLRCEKAKTYFEPVDFKEQNASDIPDQIFNQVHDASLKSIDGKWERSLFKQRYIKRHLKNNQFLTKVDSEQIWDEVGRQPMLSVSDPIFDVNQENCVVSIVYQNFRGSAFGNSFFLRKSNGQWLIIFTYNSWIS